MCLQQDPRPERPTLTSGQMRLCRSPEYSDSRPRRRSRHHCWMPWDLHPLHLYSSLPLRHLAAQLLEQLLQIVLRQAAWCQAMTDLATARYQKLRREKMRRQQVRSPTENSATARSQEARSREVN
jgi:hypothetical protein